MFWKLIRPAFFALPPEAAHRLAFFWLERIQNFPTLIRLFSGSPILDPKLQTRVFGLDFPNPVGLAAGFDKDAHLLSAWQALGFGFAEMGTITSLSQPGNPLPRLFRLPDQQALINRMGFNNDGAEKVAERLRRYSSNVERRALVPRSFGEGGSSLPPFPVGINLGKNKVTPLEKAADDYVSSFEKLCDLGDYFVVNVSSPNTPGLRDLQEKPRLDEIFRRLQEKNRNRLGGLEKPILVKISPDLNWEQLDDVLELCFKHRMAGVVATNTTLDRAISGNPPLPEGGLSGHPLKKRSTECIRRIDHVTGGKIPIIGVGGIFSAEDAWEKIRAGASLVQIYTGYVYEGPELVRQINEGLLKFIERDGFRQLSEAIGG